MCVLFRKFVPIIKYIAHEYEKNISVYTTIIYCRLAINNLVAVTYIKKYRPKKVDCLPRTTSMLKRCDSLHVSHVPSSSPEKAWLQPSHLHVCVRFCVWLIIYSSRYQFLKYLSLLEWSSNRWRLTFIQFFACIHNRTTQVCIYNYIPNFGWLVAGKTSTLFALKLISVVWGTVHHVNVCGNCFWFSEFSSRGFPRKTSRLNDFAENANTFHFNELWKNVLFLILWTDIRGKPLGCHLVRDKELFLIN